MPPRAVPTVNASTARRLFLGAQGLLDDPARRATPAVVRKIVQKLGYVQVDSINVIERAHHLILAGRLDGYEPRMLHRLLERNRTLFEHWTHDASAIPSEWFGHWQVRFERFRARRLTGTWWAEHFSGDQAQTLTHVVDRITAEGPLKSSDFQSNPRAGGGWWEWKPQKAALEILWRSGTLSIARRENFQKAYDLTERVMAGYTDLPVPDDRAHVDWACAAAIDRLGIATTGEIARFLRAVTLAEARNWCTAATDAGDLVTVEVASAGNGRPWRGYARPDWEHRATRPAPPPKRIRLLCPFDPILRDRARTARLFAFDYRFEAFTPAAKRRYGYYVMPIMEGDRLVGRLDPKLHRDRGELQVRGVWWEPGVRPTRSRMSALRSALGRLAGLVGADSVSLPRATRM
ncbi:MAG: YcaQ family DNA glycosylase [Planctomycetes bacterium]|nr:YcaQ family DNA glycosylase [Planctomycetota bacterium]